MSTRYEIETGGAAPKPDAVRKRLDRMERALTCELWVPFGLRSLLAHELPLLRKQLLSRKRSWHRRASQRIHELAMASYRYRGNLLESEVVSQLRILDLELNPSRISTSMIEEWRSAADDELFALESRRSHDA